MADLKKYITEPGLVFEGFFRQVSSYSVFQNKSEFKVKVLTNPIPYTGPDPDIETGEPLSDQKSQKYWFKGRILDPNMAHEKFLPDPCDNTIAADPEYAQALTSLHTTIFAEAEPDCSIGDIILAFAGPGDNNKIYNLQHMKWIKTETKNSGPLVIGQECFKLSDYDWSNAEISGQQTGNYIGSNSEFRDKEITNGLIHEEYPALISRANTNTSKSGWATQLISDVVEDFEKMANAFYEHFNSPTYISDNPGIEGREIKLKASGYRTYQTQLELKQTKPSLAATPGTSKHGWGMAIDIENIDWQGKEGFESQYFLWMIENSNKYNWYHPYWASLQRDGKKEPWHFEYKLMSNIISGQRSTSENSLSAHNEALKQSDSAEIQKTQETTASGNILESEGQTSEPDTDESSAIVDAAIAAAAFPKIPGYP